MSEPVLGGIRDRVTVIRPRRGWASLGLDELWEHRELLRVFVWRDIAVRYKQTLLGAAWAVLQPFMSMVVFTIFFGRLAGLERQTGGVPYSLFTFAALVPWSFFVHVLAQASTSVLDNRGILTKVYFPRLILPLSPLLSGLLDFAISMVFLFGLMAWYGVVPGPSIVFLPVFLVMEIVSALAVGLWLAGLNALYRDFRYVIPFLLNLWMFATPVVYSSSIVPDHWKTIYGLNLMAGVIQGFRWSLLGVGEPPGAMIWASFAMMLLLAVGGLEFFRRVERRFVDVL